MSWWIGYGALWSAGAMINPSLIAVLPPLALWAIWPLRDRLGPQLQAGVGVGTDLCGRDHAVDDSQLRRLP